MARVDFYILPEGAGVDRFACIMAAKAWSKGNRVHIHTQSEETSTIMDNLLWTYHDISFVPHQLLAQDTDEETPVTISYGDRFPEHQQVIINLDHEIPGSCSGFERIIEIVGGDETTKKYARQRYRQYRDQGYETHDHRIENI